MYTYKTHSWTEIVERYRELVQDYAWPIQPMLDLVTFIADSPYAAGLFPLTSMDRLRIGRHPDFQPCIEELVIDFDMHKQLFVFSYWSHPALRKPWQRQYTPEASQAALERFLLKYARWFTRHPSN